MTIAHAAVGPHVPGPANAKRRGETTRWIETRARKKHKVKLIVSLFNQTIISRFVVSRFGLEFVCHVLDHMVFYKTINFVFVWMQQHLEL